MTPVKVDKMAEVLGQCPDLVVADPQAAELRHGAERVRQLGEPVDEEQQRLEVLQLTDLFR